MLAKWAVFAMTCIVEARKMWQQRTCHKHHACAARHLLLPSAAHASKPSRSSFHLPLNGAHPTAHQTHSPP